MARGHIFGTHNINLPSFIFITLPPFHHWLLVLWLWKSKYIPRIKLFFMWLLFNDRLNTRDILRRRNEFLQEGYNYAMCHEGVEEIGMHLFFKCSYSITRWMVYSQKRWIVCVKYAVVHPRDFFQMITQQKLHMGMPFFMEIFMIEAQCI